MSCFGPFTVVATWQLGVFPNQGESYNYSKQVYTIWLVPILDVDFIPERNSVFHLLAIRFPAIIYYKKIVGSSILEAIGSTCWITDIITLISWVMN